MGNGERDLKGFSNLPRGTFASVYCIVFPGARMHIAPLVDITCTVDIMGCAERSKVASFGLEAAQLDWEITI